MSGLAGVGKSELVLHAAHAALAEERFLGGVLFKNLQGYDDKLRVLPGDALESFLRALGVSEIPPAEDERAALYRSILTGQPRMLIVLDNARSADQVRPLLPGRPGHRVMVTSRHLLSGLDGARHVELDVLDEPEAATLVGDAELARLCGGLPLALQIMRALMVTDPRADWAAELRGARDRLDVIDDGDRPPVYAAFELSYGSLTPDQQRLFRLLALHPGDEFDLHTVRWLVDLPPERVRSLFRELRRAHLLENGVTADWYRFHDLVRLFARRCLSDEPAADRDTAVKRLLSSYVVMMEAVRDDLSRLPAVNRHHVGVVAAVGMATATGNHELGHHLGFLLVRYLYFASGWRDLRTVMEHVLVSARAHDDKVAEFKALKSLGDAHRELKSFDEAISCLRSALELASRFGDRAWEDLALHGLGDLYTKMGRFDDAVACLERCAVIDRELDDRRSEGLTLASLGCAYHGLHRLDEAIACLSSAVTIFREIGDRHTEGLLLNDLGTAYYTRQDFAEAFDAFADSVRIKMDFEDLLRAGQGLYNMGLVHRHVGAVDAAARTWTFAVKVLEKAGATQEVERVRAALDLLRGKG
ncbi:tetratricopeptide repeat protein [Lentzea sp. NBRC 105346]|uniref:tetratricopeptide repeat protein n=1 Tax=Lentzea sp. NBRC 105346 TaxID=3032205 RepID=UPI002555FB2F|nr:tetratricopeptide repeat protein [Lentzea sp. NBRC 105346]